MGKALQRQQRSEDWNAQLPYKMYNHTTRKMQTQNKPQMLFHTH